MVKYGEAQESDQSEFNAAIANLMLINEVKKLLILSTLHHNYDEKYNSLTAYFMAMISIMKDKDDEEQELRWKEVTKLYYEYLGLKKKNKAPPISIWEEFLKWEIELRNMEQKYGLALPKKQDARFAMASSRR